MKIAIFDVCDTIYNVNTTFFFLDYYFKNNTKFKIFRKITKFFPIKVINFLICKLFRKDFIKLYATSYLKGEEINKIDTYSKEFVNSVLTRVVNTSVVSMIKEFKGKGYQIILMSGAYDFIIKQVANYFKANDFFASKIYTKEKLYIGKFEKDILMNKYNIFKENFKNFEDLIVVSNNKTDLKLMNIANKAYAICNKKSDLKFWNNHKKIKCIKNF